MGTGFLYHGSSAWGVKLTTHFHLMLRDYTSAPPECFRGFDRDNFCFYLSHWVEISALRVAENWSSCQNFVLRVQHFSQTMDKSNRSAAVTTVPLIVYISAAIISRSIFSTMTKFRFFNIIELHTYLFMYTAVDSSVRLYKGEFLVLENSKMGIHKCNSLTTSSNVK